jgi:FXSXX-COOH protein
MVGSADNTFDDPSILRRRGRGTPRQRPGRSAVTAVDPVEAPAPGEGDDRGEVLDLTGLPLADIRVSDDSVLAAVMRRLLERVDDPDKAIAGFNSAL